MSTEIRNRWEEYAQQFYGIGFGQANPVVPEALPFKKETYPWNSVDTVSRALVIDPSDFGGTPLVFLDKTDTSVCAADPNFRVPPGIYDYVPLWLHFVKQVEALAQDVARWAATKTRISREWGPIPGLLIGMIQRLAGDAMANIGYLFRGEGLLLLPGRVKFIAGKLKQATSSAMDTLSQGLAKAASWLTGAWNWLLGWLS